MSSIITDPFRQKLLLSAVALGVVMDGIDGSIVNVALPTMATYFDTDTGTDRMGDHHLPADDGGAPPRLREDSRAGVLQKNCSSWDLSVFTLGSAACGIAPTLDILLAARLMQGIGAAMIAAVALLLCIRYLRQRDARHCTWRYRCDQLPSVLPRAGNRGNPHPVLCRGTGSSWSTSRSVSSGSSLQPG
ncbi:MAG: hypothetical protein MZV65_31225 [Chromatiales bacterium]|nr:hypothetical protein [Chromatiales bacterium]